MVDRPKPDLIKDLDLDTRVTLEALAEPDDDTSSIRSLRAVGDSGGDPADPTHEEPVDDEEVQDEDDRTSSDAPWSPVPTKQARQFLHDHPEAKLQVIFPTVYEEDRSAMIADIGTVEQLGYASKRRCAEQAAQEMGWDDYDYDEEKARIAEEAPPMPEFGGFGADGSIPADGNGMSPDGMPPEMTPGDAGQFDNLPQKPKRAELAGPVQAEFKKQQQESEKLRAKVDALSEDMKRILEGFARMETARLVEANRPAPEPINVNVHPTNVEVHPPAVTVQPPAVTVEGAHVEVHPPNVTVQPPNVEIHQAAPGAVVKTVEHDAAGRITKVTETPQDLHKSEEEK